VRRTATEAAASSGNMSHHLQNKKALIAESYRMFSRRLTDSFEAAVESAGTEPRARLRAFFKAVFSRPNLDPQVLTAWVVYWGLLQTSPEIRAIHDEEGRGYGDLLGTLLNAFARESGRLRFDTRLATIGLTALLDGLWLEWCLDPKNFRPAEAAALCEVWIDKLTRA